MRPSLSGAAPPFRTGMRRFRQTSARQFGISGDTSRQDWRSAERLETWAGELRENDRSLVAELWSGARVNVTATKLLEQLAGASLGASQCSTHPEDRMAIRARRGRLWSCGARRGCVAARGHWV